MERGGGRSGYRERRRREGFWRVPFEDPLWNFKGGGAPPAPPYYINLYGTIVCGDNTIYGAGADHLGLFISQGRWIHFLLLRIECSYTFLILSS